MVTFKAKNGKEYKLGFTRETAKEAERKGVNIIDGFDNAPMNTIEMLYIMAFQANHPQLEYEKRLKIIGDLENKTELVKVLGEEFAKTFNTLMSEPDEKNAVKWEVTE